MSVPFPVRTLAQAFEGGVPTPAGSRPSPALAVTRLRLSEFRCYASLVLDVTPKPVVLFGANGAGKTNLLEALSFLVPGKGLRGAALAEAARTGSQSGAWAVAATVATPDGPIDVGTGRDTNQGGADRRVVRIDGETRRGQGVLGEHLAAVWLTPAMDRLFQEGASERRRFLDRLVVGHDPEHTGRSSAYAHALRERSRLLKTARETGRPADPAWLAGLEDTLARHGVAVAAARREVVARLDRACRGAEGPFPQAALALDGVVERWLGEGSALEAEDRLKAALAAGRTRDAALGGACEGPHRSDLAVTHLGRGRPAADCSTGEQKAMLIALLLAQSRVLAAQRGRVPLLLLDEVAAHLDAVRRQALFDALEDLGAQAWMTGTDKALFTGFGERAQFLRVDEAKLSAETAV